MNERIIKLAEDADAYADAMDFGGKNYIGLRDEFFAELIVRECAERLLNDAKLTDIQTTRCVASIREHFGVEE